MCLLLCVFLFIFCMCIFLCFCFCVLFLSYSFFQCVFFFVVFVFASIRQGRGYSKCRVPGNRLPSRSSVLEYWQFLPSGLMSDREVVQALLAHATLREVRCSETDQSALRDISEQWSADRDIIMAAVA